MKFSLTILPLCMLALQACIDPALVQQTPAQHSPSGSLAETQSGLSTTMPDGTQISGVKMRLQDGSFYVGAISGGQFHGQGAILGSNHTSSYGNFVAGQRVGVHKFFNGVNGLVTFEIYENGKLIKAYGELDALLASGDYEAFYQKRGQRVFAGFQFKDENGRIVVNNVIPNSPADIAGLQQGDVLLSINQQSMLQVGTSGFLNALINLPFGRKAEFSFDRGGVSKKLSFVPGVVPKQYPGADSTASLLWNKLRSQDSTRAYEHYLQNVTDTTYHPQARQRLAQLRKNESRDLAAFKAKGSSGVIEFCKRYPDSSLLGDELVHVFSNLHKQKNFIQGYDELLLACPVARQHQPARYELLHVGPEGMTVRDALRLSRSGMGADVLATKIRYSRQAYRDFTADELGHLSAFGVDDRIVAAMLESTYQQEQKSAEEYRQRVSMLENEVQQLKQKQSTVRQVSTSGQPVQDESSMPLECIKLVAALKACDQASGLLAFGCEAAARTSFDCPLPVDKLLR